MILCYGIQENGLYLLFTDIYIQYLGVNCHICKHSHIQQTDKATVARWLQIVTLGGRHLNALYSNFHYIWNNRITSNIQRHIWPQKLKCKRMVKWREFLKYGGLAYSPHLIVMKMGHTNSEVSTEDGPGEPRFSIQVISEADLQNGSPHWKGAQRNTSSAINGRYKHKKKWQWRWCRCWQSRAQGAQPNPFTILLSPSQQPELVQPPPKAGCLTNAKRGLLYSPFPLAWFSA